ncbi:MAG: 4-alpha-glucanotransferase [Huintestinicola sp.]
MRSCGVLMHISSLPSPYGIGTLGREAYEFVDFLKSAGQSIWQILPIGPTGFGDSPYQSYSAYAGNPLFIDLDQLMDEGLISPDDKDMLVISRKNDFADYAQLFSFRKLILAKAYNKFCESACAEAKYEFDKFCRKNNFWLEDYALFMSLKGHFHGQMWTMWDNCYRLRDKDALKKYAEEHTSEIGSWKFMQFKFFKQYRALKKYANKKGIKLYGDMPIYVSMDSSDIWANPQLFMLDEDCCPVKVAGCPPDDFSPTGQLWGNPLYDWDEMKKDGYRWWVSRVRYASKLFDITRIDHFRGFESYYAIPSEDKTAENGEWLKGPSMGLFNAIKAELGEVSLVAEDLGFLTEDVREMLRAAGYPGMNVLEFAFGSAGCHEDSGYLPHNYVKNSVVYIGTHDNETALGWYENQDKDTKRFIRSYLGLKKKASSKEVVWALIRAAYASVSDMCIIQAQDILCLDNTARMNIPSTIGNGNWAWRINGSVNGTFTPALAKKLKKLAKVYFRKTKSKKPSEAPVLPEEQESGSDPHHSEIGSDISTD